MSRTRPLKNGNGRKHEREAGKRSNYLGSETMFSADFLPRKMKVGQKSSNSGFIDTKGKKGVKKTENENPK